MSSLDKERKLNDEELRIIACVRRFLEDYCKDMPNFASSDIPNPPHNYELYDGEVLFLAVYLPESIPISIRRTFDSWWQYAKNRGEYRQCPIDANMLNSRCDVGIKLLKTTPPRVGFFWSALNVTANLGLSAAESLKAPNARFLSSVEVVMAAAQCNFTDGMADGSYLGYILSGMNMSGCRTCKIHYGRDTTQTWTSVPQMRLHAKDRRYNVRPISIRDVFKEADSSMGLVSNPTVRIL